MIALIRRNLAEIGIALALIVTAVMERVTAMYPPL